MDTTETRYFTRLGRRMLAARIKAGLSQRELEARLNYKSSMVSGYETGKRDPRLVTLLAFAKALGCDVRELIPSSESEADDPKINGVEPPEDVEPQYPVPDVAEPVKPQPAAPPKIKKTERVDVFDDRSSGTMPWSENPDPAAW